MAAVASASAAAAAAATEPSVSETVANVHPDSDAVSPSPDKMDRTPQPPPVPEGVPVPPLFQEWAQKNGYVASVALSESRSSFGISKYGQPLMSEDGRDSVEDALDEVGDFNHYMQKAALRGENTTVLGPHVRAMMHLFVRGFDGKDRPAAMLAANAYASNSLATLETIEAEVQFMQAFIHQLQHEAQTLCIVDGFSLSAKASHVASDETGPSVTRRCYKCGSTQTVSTEVRKPPVCLGPNVRTMYRSICESCQE